MEARELPDARVVVTATGRQNGDRGSGLHLEDAGGPVTLDLRELLTVDAHFAARLAAWLDVQSAAGRSVEVAPPGSPSVARQMARLGCSTDLPAGCTFSLPDLVVGPRDDVLLPLTRLEDSDQINELTIVLRKLLSDQFPDSRISDAMVLILQELGDNATSHGQSDLGAYVCASRAGPTRCNLAIGDLGVGVPTHIRRIDASLMGDGAAIAHAVQPGVSGTPDPDRGDGYHAMLETVRRNAVARMDLHVWSGNGTHRIDIQRDHRDEHHTADIETHTSGTWIALEMDA